MIDGILQDKGFTPTTYEKYLCSGKVDNTKVLFLRQVDEFAVATPIEEIENKIFAMIHNKLLETFNLLGNLEL